MRVRKKENVRVREKVRVRVREKKAGGQRRMRRCG